VKVAIHQPQYFPWPPYVHKVMSADIFVYLDTVQFSKNGLQNRNQIKTSQGASWLTIPVKQNFGQSILQTVIADSRCSGKHFKTLQGSYARTLGFERWRAELEQLLMHQHSLLVDLAMTSTNWMLSKLGVRTQLLRASEMTGLKGEASELVASICKELSADVYLTGTGALAYLNVDDFANIECAIEVQTWHPFQYSQAHESTGFIRDLSTLDLLLNCPDNANELIASAGGWQTLSGK
jgi:WbqC-like protein family